ncbi:hypothetical protein MW887_006178 [Aspergillus wentii]|nr:hypothetical protein MW887_006178 [Aspergillus wentii]
MPLPFLPKRKKQVLTLADWKWNLKYEENPRSFLPALLSTDLSFLDKVQIIERISAMVYRKTSKFEMLEGEVRLHFGDDIRLAQLLRYKLFYTDYYHKRWMEWCKEVIVLDFTGRWIVQREIYVQEKIQALKKAAELSASESDEQKSIAPQISACKDELENLNGQYWSYHTDHAERIRTGIFSPGYARTVLDEEAVVGEIVDAVRGQEIPTELSIEATVPMHAAVAFAHEEFLIPYSVHINRAYIWGIEDWEKLD